EEGEDVGDGAGVDVGEGVADLGDDLGLAHCVLRGGPLRFWGKLKSSSVRKQQPTSSRPDRPRAAPQTGSPSARTAHGTHSPGRRKNTTGAARSRRQPSDVTPHTPHTNTGGRRAGPPLTADRHRPAT